MGNHCGDLALWSGIACGAEIVITAQTGFEETEVLERLKEFDVVKKKRHAIVVISEKITDVDAFAKKVSLNTGFSGRATVLGHVQRGGSPTPIDRVLASRMGEKLWICCWPVSADNVWVSRITRLLPYRSKKHWICRALPGSDCRICLIV